jgi:predicted DNA-binding protein YlxM (UPF0122 family)
MTHKEILKKHTKQLNYGWSYYYDDDQILKAMAEAVAEKDVQLKAAIESDISKGNELIRQGNIQNQLYDQLAAKDKEIAELKEALALKKKQRYTDSPNTPF